MIFCKDGGLSPIFIFYLFIYLLVGWLVDFLFVLFWAFFFKDLFINYI